MFDIRVIVVEVVVNFMLNIGSFSEWKLCVVGCFVFVNDFVGCVDNWLLCGDDCRLIVLYDNWNLVNIFIVVVVIVVLYFLFLLDVWWNIGFLELFGCV